MKSSRWVQETGRTQAQIAEKLSVSANTVCRWIKQYGQEKTESFPGSGCQTSQAALISRLRRENERLRKERDFLKQTSAYFAAKSESYNALKVERANWKNYRARKEAAEDLNW